MITIFATSIRKMYLCIKFNNKNRMSKEFAEKIMLPRTPVNIKDVSAASKKALLLFLMPKGFSIATFYKRFFQKGFSTWELVGVKECKRRFLALPEVKQKIEDSEQNAPEDFPLSLADEDNGRFYAALKEKGQGLCKKFASFMKENGMSERTTCTRFTSDNWKDWENVGILPLLKTFSEQTSQHQNNIE